MKKAEVRKVDELIFRKDLYPRIETSPVIVQQYADSLDMLPPIEINQHNEIIDGWHRWTAHKKAKVDTIKVFVTETKSDTHLLELAIERNATHGLQLSQEDKHDLAHRIYNLTPERERNKKKKYLAKILSVPERTLQEWLSRIDKDSKEARDKKIFNLWLSCHTQQEIAEMVGLSQPQVNELLSEMAILPKSIQPVADHLVDFEVPLYNVWKFKGKSQGSRHSGNTEPTILDNLLYLYTKPFDTVVDLFAGGGSTIDVCKKRLRRYFVSDRLPIPERAEEIRQHDVTTGLPHVPRWLEVKLVYFDPPYWKQSEGAYSQDPTDLANMSLEDFNKILSNLIRSCAKKLSDAYIALIIQPTQWNAPEHDFTDHVGDMLRLVKLPCEMRYSVPYESQQCTAQMVEWAKASKKCLVLTREIIIWKCQ